jgi:hypothetical protein
VVSGVGVVSGAVVGVVSGAMVGAYCHGNWDCTPRKCTPRSTLFSGKNGGPGCGTVPNQKLVQPHEVDFQFYRAVAL